MYTGLLHLHSLLRWIILLLLVIAIFMSLGGMTGKKPFGPGQKKAGLFLMIAAHIELLIGLYQWLFGPWGIKYLSNAGMKDRVALFYGVEHITGMIVAIVLITIGRGVSKKNLPDGVKQKRTFWFFLVALVIILALIPWPGRVAIGRPWI
ncbi:MAG TPA: hypothetical protein VHC48_12370 [Puia sp.]|nr:hypothetical protein [Puia sp.]